MSRRSRIINLGRSTTEDLEPLIDLPHEKKAGIGGDLLRPENQCEWICRNPAVWCLSVCHQLRACSFSSLLRICAIISDSWYECIIVVSHTHA